jgi:hypothetical protein
MASIRTPEEIDHNRRRFVETAAIGVAAASTGGLLPEDVAAATQDNAIRPFRVSFSEEQLADLRRRIAATRWPDKEQVTDETQGVRLATMRSLSQHWQTSHDWRNVERGSTPCRNL